MYFYQLSAFLLDSRPVANEECFIHFINIKPKYDVPDVARKKFCHNLLELNYNFGIMTRKALPNVSTPYAHINLPPEYVKTSNYNFPSFIYFYSQKFFFMFI